MAVNPEVMLQVATGGKGNDLKLWNGNRLDTPVFQAKNVCPMSIVSNQYHCSCVWNSFR